VEVGGPLEAASNAASRAVGGSWSGENEGVEAGRPRPGGGGTSAEAQGRSESHPEGDAFYKVRRQAALDTSLTMADRLRAIEQIESRALGKPKESVTVDTQESDAERALRELTPAQRMELWQARGLRAVEG
jgi:hypothetical protein